MVTIQEIISVLENAAPKAYQEEYDNAGLITGNALQVCSGALLSLDATEIIIDEAIAKGCNLVIAHHPIVFQGLKSLTGKNYVERTIIKAIKHDIAIYAMHTNLDNMVQGVNAKIAEKLGLQHLQVLQPKTQTLYQLVTFVPKEHVDQVANALLETGVGSIGNYDYCSFRVGGVGTFRPKAGAQPTIGSINQHQKEQEVRLEMLVPAHLKQVAITTLQQVHPYEEVAYYLTALSNQNQDVGSGMIGELEHPVDELEFLSVVKSKMKSGCVRYTQLLGEPIKKVAVCGGAGSFLLSKAIAKGAQVFITADFKYHEFFNADKNIVIADIGHYESEQYTSEVFAEIINKNFSTFAVHFSENNTNPINYL